MQGIDYHISEPKLHNHNPVEGFIREVSCKWYCNMVKKRVSRKLCDYGLSWVSKVMSMINYSENGVNVGITLVNVTVNTVDISKYLEFNFNDKFWFKDNYGISTSETGKWLGILHWTGRLMCYHILTQTGKAKYIFTIHQVANFELSTDKFKESL